MTAYSSISPFLSWINRTKLAAEKWKPEHPLKKFYFRDGNEGGQFHTDVLSIDSLLKKNKLQNLKFKYVYYPDESHVSN